jgi:hypothetical protein
MDQDTHVNDVYVSALTWATWHPSRVFSEPTSDTAPLPSINVKSWKVMGTTRAVAAAGCKGRLLPYEDDFSTLAVKYVRVGDSRHEQAASTAHRQLTMEVVDLPSWTSTLRSDTDTTSPRTNFRDYSSSQSLSGHIYPEPPFYASECDSLRLDSRSCNLNTSITIATFYGAHAAQHTTAHTGGDQTARLDTPVASVYDGLHTPRYSPSLVQLLRSS